MSNDYHFPILTHCEIESWKMELDALHDQLRMLHERARWLENKLHAASNLIAAKAVPRPDSKRTPDEGLSADGRLGAGELQSPAPDPTEHNKG